MLFRSRKLRARNALVIRMGVGSGAPEEAGSRPRAKRVEMGRNRPSVRNHQRTRRGGAAIEAISDAMREKQRWVSGSITGASLMGARGHGNCTGIFRVEVSGLADMFSIAACSIDKPGRPAGSSRSQFSEIPS